MSNQNTLSETDNDAVLNETAFNADVDQVLASIKSGGMTNKLWGDLCYAAASKCNKNAVDFRSTLVEHLSTIGFEWKSLFCHIQTAGTFYRNAWQGTYYYVNLQIGDTKYSGFLTY